MNRPQRLALSAIRQLKNGIPAKSITFGSRMIPGSVPFQIRQLAMTHPDILQSVADDGITLEDAIVLVSHF